MIQRRVVFQQSVVFIKYSSGFGDGRTARDGIVIRRAETYCIIYVMIFFFRQAAVYVRLMWRMERIVLYTNAFFCKLGRRL